MLVEACTDAPEMIYSWDYDSTESSPSSLPQEAQAAAATAAG